MIEPLIITPLNATTFTAILAPKSCETIGFWVEGVPAYYLATDADGTDAGLVPEKFPIEITKRHLRGEAMIYAKAAGGTPNMVTIILK